MQSQELQFSNKWGEVVEEVVMAIYYAYLSGNSLEKSVDHTTGETSLLKLVHLDNLTPVCRYFG